MPVMTMDGDDDDGDDIRMRTVLVWKGVDVIILIRGRV